MSEVKKIGVLTSGGDAPGMNAAIRAVVRTAIHNGVKVVGIKRGFDGLINGEFMEMDATSVSNIMYRGGTALLTARCPEMLTEEGQKKAAQIYKVLGLDALIVIGGDGSLHGAQSLIKFGVNVMGIPGTIDLDLDCTDYTIGFDTAVNTGMDAINKIRDTSCSHERCSIVEVMGRNAGYIALWCGVTGGAEEVLIPENPHIDTDAVIKQILENRCQGKNHNLIVVAEGIGGSQELAKKIEEVTGIQTRATILGHLQRGGIPTAVDRMHASMMGYYSVKEIVNGKKNRIMVYRDGKYLDLDLNEALEYKREYDNELYEITKILSI